MPPLGVAPTASQLTGKQKLDFFITFIGCYLLFVALVICAVAGRTAFRLHTVKTTWPTVQAEVLGCEQIVGQRVRNGAIPQATECRFQYAVNGRSYTATTRTLFTAPPSKNAPQWIADHPPGSRMTLYYSPGQPAKASMGGADAAIDSEEPMHFFRAAAFFGLAGLILIATVMIMRRRSVDLQ